MTRALSLKRETLAALTVDELAVVAGGTYTPTEPVLTVQSLRPDQCLALSVYLHCGDITYQPRCF